jgi:hypothetical protein
MDAAIDAAKIADPSLWAQLGGLNGLVIFALFVSLAIFLRALSKIYDMHRSDMRALLDMHAQERESWGHIVDARQKETNAAIQAMAAAVNELNARARRYTNGRSHDEP